MDSPSDGRAEDLEMLLNTVPAAVWISRDPECRTIFGNRQANQLTGAGAGDNISATTVSKEQIFFDPVSGRKLAPEELPMQVAAATNSEICGHEIEARLPTGERRSLLGNAVPLRDEHGAVRGCIGAFIDISPRRAAETAAVRGLQRAELLADVSSSLLETENVRLSIADSCRKIMSFLGCDFFVNFLDAVDSSPAIINAHCGLSLDEADIIAADPRGDLVRTLGIQTYVTYSLTVKGTSMGTLSFGSRSRTHFADDEISMMREVASLVTAALHRKRTEEALKESEARFRAITDNIPQHAWINGVNGEVLWFNKRWWEYSGVAPTRTEGLGARIIHPDHLERVQRKFQACMAAGAEWEDVFPMRRRDGEYRWFLSRAVPLRDAQGQIYRWCGTNTDITEERKLARLLEEQKQALSESYADLEQFSYVASHDLQEPLRTIANFGDLLKRTQSSRMDEKGLHYLARIDEAVMRLHSLVESLLSYSRSGRHAVKKEPIHPNDVIARVLRDLQEAVQSRHAEVKVRELPDVLGDPVMIAQVFQNLISNALKFNDKTVHIDISGQTAEDKVQFRVKDNGIGVERDYLGRLFDPFKRLHRQEKYAGSGIGLAITRKVVDRHGGRIWANSAVGKGTTFYFTLPRAR